MEIAFVYNAETGWFNAVADSLHKLFSPTTYSCDLCALTHGLTGMKPVFKRFMASAGWTFLFYHLDDIPGDLKEHLDGGNRVPAVFVKKGSVWELLYGPSGLSGFRNTENFLEALKYRLQE